MDTLENTSYKMDTLERYFTEVTKSSEKRYEAKAVLVDMEEKVVHACRQTAAKTGLKSFEFTNTHTLSRIKISGK